MRTARLGTLTGVLFLALGSALSAPLTRAETLSFQQAVEKALSQNPDLAVSQAQIQQAEAALRQAEGNRKPRLNLSLTATRSNDALNAFGLKLSQRGATFNDFGAAQFTGPAALGVAPHNLNHPDAVTNINPRVELLIPVYNGGMVKRYVEQAQAYVRAAQSGDRQARQEVIKHVLMAYQGVHTARAYVQVAEQGIAAAQEYVRITEKLHKQGMVVKSDLLSARVNLEDVKLKRVEARNAEAAALDQLHLLLGKPLDEPLDVGAPVTPGMLAGSDADLRQQALDSHAGLQALRSQLQGAGAAVAAARAGHKPQFNVMLRGDVNDEALGFGATSYTVAGVLSWAAFDGGVTKAGVDRAEAQRTELAARLRQAEDGVRYQVGDARRKAMEAEEKIAARRIAVEQAGEAQRLVQRRYENGVATLIELFSAQAQLDKARAELVAARYDLAVSRAELKRAVGVLTPEQL
ncbi:MAG TPA: TolC family protein [Thiobacillaceae bacterium]|nr:TolC family protein [Thiobacillaceae bacterium]HNU64570.1 TolC family protein [Thiobacillaceae bacterium]